MKTLDVVAFQGASNLPMWVAEEQGFFARHGLVVTLSITPNSVELARDLHTGRRQVALTAFDNVVTYVEAQGEAGIEGGTDFFAFMGIDDAVLSLMAAPDVPDIAALRGQSLAVDALTTGYAFVLREMLRLSGLTEAETPFFRVGGHGMRLEALLEGRTAATLLTTPPDLVAEAKGFRRLARATDMIGAYAGVTGNASRAWAAANRETLVAFIRAWKDAIDWIGAAENRDAVGALFRARMGGAPAVADRACALLIDPVRGLRRDLTIDPAGIATVLRLRSTYAVPARPLTDPARYIDLSYLAEATGG
ncbi:ABC transporter substrate-binding protein [Roseomonas stagni]|uniref:ABC transporter substrate-binding protein n=1 Tax=Falsiroseomonas algicola TaxID=2716930 RepID=A0A6M1LRA2_9PROT|nr:ABC transporter substrate-binding protein [Falsiroseomonas algicola]NGM22529.1 ABC transporter substrate-binding protein [Falsiroseomonas algicola]